jgi:hypothetical protein
MSRDSDKMLIHRFPVGEGLLFLFFINLKMLNIWSLEIIGIPTSLVITLRLELMSPIDLESL